MTSPDSTSTVLRSAVVGTLTLFSAVGAGAQSPEWAAHATPQPSRRANYAMAYDTARGRLVVFAGQGASGDLADTWEWDGVGWHRMRPLTIPPARAAATAAYDRARGVVVMFGGTGGDAATWEWDGVNWRRRAFLTSPPPRQSHAMAYDESRQRVVLFGGGNPFREDTWEYDGLAWVRRADGPRQLVQAAMAYDAARQRVILFGGADTSGPYDATYAWDGTAWTEVGTGARPSARSSHAMAYDSIRQRVVLSGGVSATATLADVWEWDGSQWGQRPGSRLRSGHELVFDTVRGNCVTFGGHAGLTFPEADLAAWDGTTWTTSQVPLPAPRATLALTFDSFRQRTVLFGGTRLGTGAYLGDTWEFDGSTWSPGPITGPSPRFGAAFVYDPARGYSVLFGGSDRSTLNDTWLYDGTAWTQLMVLRPPPRAHATAFYDSLRQRVVVLGGFDSFVRTDMLEWSGTAWVTVPAGTFPWATLGDAAAYDSVRDRVVVVGASGAFEWDRATWRPITAAVAPPARRFASMTFDPIRRRVVLVGGQHSTTFRDLGDTWEWDGSTWTEHTVTSPGARSRTGIASDSSGRAVLFGGDANSEVWIYGPPRPVASSTVLGPGCSGTAAQPTLAGNLPWLGNPAFALDLAAAPASTACAFVLGAGQQALNLGGGCTLFLAGVLVQMPASTSALGDARVQFPVPSTVALRGTSVFAQAVALDAQSQVFGLAFSQGRQYVLGD